MATDTWQQARGGVVELWRRVRPRETQTVEDELTETRTILVSDGGAQAAGDLTEQWQARLLELLLADRLRADELARELQRLTRRIETAAPPAPRTDSVRMNARATDGGRIYQSAGDMNITER
jgi:hypothetical protein